MSLPLRLPAGVIDLRVADEQVGDERVIADPARLQEILQARLLRFEGFDHWAGSAQFLFQSVAIDFLEFHIFVGAYWSS
jgi:hypothetical protein